METSARRGLIDVALRALNKSSKHPRSYALGDEAKIALASFYKAILDSRLEKDVQPTDSPSAEEEMVRVIHALDAAGCNLLQKRRSDAKPLPKPWLDPVTQQPIPPPTDLKGRTLLRKYDPELADHYEKMQADPYGYIQKLREDEAMRHALAEISYGEAQHRMNVFRGNNKTAQGEFVRRDPELAKFYEAEAKPVEINLFGKERNLTLEGRLFKDPAVGGLVLLAQRVHQNWREEDRASAERQRLEAEAALKRIAQIT